MFSLPGRDDSHTLNEEVSVADLTCAIRAWLGFNTYKKKKGEAAAQKLIIDFQNK